MSFLPDLTDAQITYAEVDYAIDQLTVGMEKTTGMKFKGRQRLVAAHEAGHAVQAALTPGYDLVTKVTILGRSNGAGGFTLFTPPEERLDSGMYSMRYLEGQLAVALGGRVAEEIVFGIEEVTTGASNDLQQVRSIARRMVAQWGFSKNKLGATSWEDTQGNSPVNPAGVSQAKEKEIDDEVRVLVAKAYEHAKEVLGANRALLDELTEALIEKETVDFRELYKMVEKSHPELAR